MSKSAQASSQAAALPEAEYEAKIAELVSREDYHGAAALQRQQALAQGGDAAADSCEDFDDDEELMWKDEAWEDSSADENAEDEAAASARVLKMLYKGNM